MGLVGEGAAAAWFQPAMFATDSTVPDWDGNFSLFIQQLMLVFGPHDPIGDAESKLRTLRMKPSDPISTYIIEFNTQAAMTRWGEAALWSQFYEGLPSRIKNQLAVLDPPTNLVGLQSLAQRIDQRYWKRESEKKREGNPDSTPNTGSRSSGGGGGGKKPQQAPKPTNNSSSASASSSGAASGSATPRTPKPYADKLGKNGKITDAERARRLKEGLCMYCGGKGHQAADCKKRTTPSQGRASAATPNSEVTPTAESKK